MAETATTDTAAEQETGRPRVAHIAGSCCAPYEKALCGRDLNGKPHAANLDGWGEDTKCVVCREINRTLALCPQCGNRLPGR
jgi:hypothetical protein